MTELNPIALALPAANNGSTANAAANLAEDFDTFLTLLTEQLQNQDPLDPMDSQQFVEQLVQFSSVEQQIASNESLETILALQAADAQVSATSWVGREVTVSTPNAALSNGEAEWTYALPRAAESTSLMITDAQGRVINTLPGQTGEGPHSFVWDGTDSAGNQMDEGIYTLNVVASDTDGVGITVPVRVTGEVTGVDMSGSDVIVELGALRASAGNVIAVRQAGAV